MRVGVVGCGIGGMAAALALARRGHEVVIFERFAEPRPVGAGLLLQPSGLAALRALGLEAAARSSGADVTRLVGHALDGRLVLNLPYRGETGLGIHRAALFELLYRAMLAEGVPVRGGAPVTAIESAEREHAALIDALGRRHDRLDLVVVADGAHSSLRPHVAPLARAPLYRWGALWAILPDPGDIWRGELRQVYDGARRMAGVLPIGQSPDGEDGVPHVSFFWSVKTTGFAAVRARGIDALKREVEEVWPEAASLLDPLDSFEGLADASYRHVDARPWTRGRLVLIGDAAHGTSPQLGQGANLALIDALALAEAVGDAAARRPVEEATGAFVKARSAHTAYYQWMSWMLTPVFQGDGQALAWLRDRTMATLCRCPVMGPMMRATLTGRATFGHAPWRGSWES